MSLTADLSDEKPSPQAPTMGPATSGSCFKSNHVMAKVAQITFGLMASYFLITCRWLPITGWVFLFVAFNASLVTAIGLCDNVIGDKLRNLLVVSTREDQRYNAIAALLLYMFGFFAVADSLNDYEPLNFHLAAGVTGMLASFAYAYNWLQLYRERRLEGTIVAKVDEFNQEEQKQRNGLV